MSYFPVFLELQDKRVYIIGAGIAGLAKAKALSGYGAEIILISDQWNPLDWKDLAVLFICKKYEPSDLFSPFLVFACTNDLELNRQIHADAARLGALGFIAGDAMNGDFITGANHRSEQLTFSVGSQGRDIRLAVKARDKIREVFP